ncbi:CmlA/FloR family chloramphenicol efflux MFS transporter [Achromobacter sp. 413638]|uniref:CmlA/FloR family chloramphenicol efflux MFS transporter n=1 Tax=Achromobacter sp. 413638 TaxID=3342385 RepID=UPI00370B7439
MPTHSSPARPDIWAGPLPPALALMAPFDLLASLAMDVYLPVVPAMPAALQTTPAMVQLTLSIYMLMLGLGQLIFGPLSDRIGRRPVLLGGALLYAAASLALAAAGSGGLFVALRLLQALGASAALVAMFATVRDVYADRPEGSTIYGLFSAMLAFVPALGPMLGAAIAAGFGWRAIFVALGAAGLLAWLRAMPRWRETRPSTPGARRPGFAPMLGSLRFWIYTLGFSAAMGAFFVFFSTSPRVLMGAAGYSHMAFSAAFSTVALVMIAATRLAPRLVARWGIAGSFARGAATMLAGAALLAGCAATTAPSFATFVMPMWLVATGMVLVVSVSANGALRDYGDASGAAVALYYAAQSLIVAGLGTLSTLALDGGSAWPLVAYCAAMPAASLLGLALLQRREVAGRED